MAPPLIDTHAHLGDPAFADDLADVLERARTAGVVAVVAVGETLDDAHKLLELAQVHPGLRPAIGLFPTVLDEQQAEALEALARTRRRDLVAIGEVGLDRYKVRAAADLARQDAIFRRFVRLAAALTLPLNVHSRAAGSGTIGALLDEGATRVQLHAFDGRPAAASPAIDAGYFFSVPPSVIRSAQMQKLVRRLPLDRILLESDAPVLGPSPGVRNEPANVRVALEAVAELKGLAPAAVARATYENALRLYGDGLCR